MSGFPEAVHAYMQTAVVGKEYILNLQKKSCVWSLAVGRHKSADGGLDDAPARTRVVVRDTRVVDVYLEQREPSDVECQCSGRHTD
jgi:hypothetical protein